MILTFSTVGFVFMFLFRTLRKNNYFLFYFILMLGASYGIETHIFKPAPFSRPAFMILAALHLIVINPLTFIAYAMDKKAACSGQWRVPELDLHTLEFLGGWPSALAAQKILHHKNRKKSYQTLFWLVLVFQIGFVYYVLRILKLL